MKKAIVTGGLGFIGSHLVDMLLTKNYSVLNIDKCSYAAHKQNLKEIEYQTHYSHLKSDISSPEEMSAAFFNFQPDVVFHLAAESHVDRSIDNSDIFIQSNIVGTYVLLKTARAYSEKRGQNNFRFIHVSTDEVYGTLSLADPSFTEETVYKPNSPYSASKAASDHLARAWHKTYAVPVIVTHCSNNYGPRQHAEKLIPMVIKNAISGKKIQIYGNGENIRDWIHVIDHCQALLAAYQIGTPGEIYNFGGNNEIKNISLVTHLCKILDRLSPRVDGKSYCEQIQFVADRKGHDFRYAVDNTKSNKTLHWEPKISFYIGLEETVRWFLHNS